MNNFLFRDLRKIAHKQLPNMHLPSQLQIGPSAVYSQLQNRIDPFNECCQIVASSKAVKTKQTRQRASTSSKSRSKNSIDVSQCSGSVASRKTLKRTSESG